MVNRLIMKLQGQILSFKCSALVQSSAGRGVAIKKLNKLLVFFSNSQIWSKGRISGPFFHCSDSPFDSQSEHLS